jgi:hypothetical protein
VEIHSEECPEYRCQECRGSCAVFVLTRESELRLCGSCFEKLRDLFHTVTVSTAAPEVRDVGLRVKSYLSQQRTIRLRLTARPT